VLLRNIESAIPVTESGMVATVDPVLPVVTAVITLFEIS
jgi:hypothetical protein